MKGKHKKKQKLLTDIISAQSLNYKSLNINLGR